MPYLLLPILAYLTFLFENKGKQNTLYKILLGLLIAFAILVVGFRGEGIGTDYWQYKGYFSAWVPKIEPGFNISTLIVRSLGGNFIIYSILYFIVTLYARIFVFKRLSYSLTLSLMVSFGFWMLVYDLNGIRQSLSIAILGIAAYYAYCRKFYKFLFFTLLAVSFHYSSLVFLPFYFLINMKIDKMGMFIIIAFVFILNVFNVSDFLFSFILDGSSDNYFTSKSQAYSKINEYNSNALFSFGVIHRLLIFLVTLFFVNKIPAEERLKRFFLISAFLNFATYLMLSRYELIATRGSLGFRYMECMFFSYIPFVYKNKFIRYVAAFVILVYVLVQVYITIAVPDGNLVPYRSILFG